MLFRLAWGAALSLACASAASAQRRAVETPDFSALKPFVEGVLAQTKAPSVAIAVSRGGKLVWEQGFGYSDPVARRPATPHTLYGVASVTKSITATELAILKQRGRLDLDAPVNRYLGAAKLRSLAWDPDEATIRRVATHTAGLTSYDAICYADEPGCDRSREDMIARYGVVFWKPGTRFDYSNLGFGVLSQAIGHVTGLPYAQTVRRDLLAPLGLRDCAPDRSARVAPHYEDGKPAPLQEELAQGASSFACSVDDLVRFGMFSLGDAAMRRPGVLTVAALKAMTAQPVEADDGLRYGLGWWINEHQHGYRVVYASGGTADSGALLYTFPSEDIVIAVAGNAGNPRLSDIADRVAGLLLPRYAADLAASTAAAPSPAPAAAAATPVDPRIAALAGTWRGEIRTWRGPCPVIFVLDARGGASASINGAPLRPERNARVYRDGIVLGAHGDIGTPDADRRRPYRIGFELYADGLGGWRGAATTWQDPGARNGGVFSYWVSLRRAPGAAR